MNFRKVVEVLFSGWLLQAAIADVHAFGVESAAGYQAEDIAEFEQAHIDNPASIENGRALYGNTCLFCHGPEGKGARAPTLVANAFAPDGGNDNLYFINTIKNGRPGTIMGAFEGSLTETEMWQIIAYLRDTAKRLAEK